MARTVVILCMVFLALPGRAAVRSGQDPPEVKLKKLADDSRARAE